MSEQIDRRRIVAAGFGLSGIGLSAVGLAAAGAAEPAAAADRNGPSAKGRPALTTALRPDSGKDETARLQTALDEAAARRLPLTLPPGRFLVRSLLLPPGTRLGGSGRGTVLQHLGGLPLLRTDTSDDVAIERLAIAGGFPIDPAWRGLVELRHTTRIAIRDITIDTSTADGLVLDQCNGTVTGCSISGAAKAGIFSIDSQGGLEISHNHLSALGNNGILVWRSTLGEDGTVIAMNRIERVAALNGGTGENGNGINVFRAGSVIVSSNRITDCAFTAVRANSASNVQILANSIARVGEVAIFAEFAFEGAVVSSNLIDGAATGISVTNFDHGGRLAVVQGNLIRNLQLHRGPSEPGGYGIFVEADAAISGNTIEGAPTAGIGIGWGRYCRDITATGNVVRNCALGISITDAADAGTVLLSANLISGSHHGSIRLTDHGRIVGADLANAPSPVARIRLAGNVAS
jgi:uncharacterized secreted repeat protein (TIGR03808 family)